MQSISVLLDQSLPWMILGTTLIVVVLLFVSSLSHDPLLDPLGIQQRQNLGVAATVVVLLVAIGIRFVYRRMLRAPGENSDHISER